MGDDVPAGGGTTCQAVSGGAEKPLSGKVIRSGACAGSLVRTRSTPLSGWSAFCRYFFSRRRACFKTAPRFEKTNRSLGVSITVSCSAKAVPAAGAVPGTLAAEGAGAGAGGTWASVFADVDAGAATGAGGATGCGAGKNFVQANKMPA